MACDICVLNVRHQARMITFNNLFPYMSILQYIFIMHTLNVLPRYTSPSYFNCRHFTHPDSFTTQVQLLAFSVQSKLCTLEKRTQMVTSSKSSPAAHLHVILLLHFAKVPLRKQLVFEMLRFKLKC